MSNRLAASRACPSGCRGGFSRAARLVDMMEAEGLVSGGAGGKAREVLVKKDYFDEVGAQLR